MGAKPAPSGLMLQLHEILTQKLIPWSQHEARSRIIVARPEMSQSQMPSGVALSAHKIRSPRVIVKKERAYNNVRSVIARWPAAGLQELGKYFLLCVVDGYVNYPVGRYYIKCGPGYFILIPPGIPCTDGSHTYVDLEKNSSCDVITFLMQPGALEIWTSHGHPQGRDTENNCLIFNKQVVTLFEMLIDEIMREDDRNLSLIEGLLGVFCEAAGREISAGRFQNVHLLKQIKAMQGTDAQDFSAKLHDYVTSHLHQRIGLESAARDLYLSPAQFARKVRQETGQSFVPYVTDFRLREARRLLEETDWTINIIQQMVGFRSSEYFCAVFKKHLNVTPSQYRQRCRKQDPA